MNDFNDEELLSALGVDSESKSKSPKNGRHEKIISGFGEIELFFTKNDRLPSHGEKNDISERILAVRLDKIKASDECMSILRSVDGHSLLKEVLTTKDSKATELDDEALLSELGVVPPENEDITKLKNVKTSADKRAAEEYARRTPCLDFEKFKPLFQLVQVELQSGLRQAHEFKKNTSIEKGDFFILGGQKAYIAETGEEYIAEYERKNKKLRVIYDNATESDILMLSFLRALYKDGAGRRIVDTRDMGPLFSGAAEENDISSGTVYVLRSKSDHPFISKSRDVIHKIGVTSNKVNSRISNAELDPTFLMAEVEVIATYELSNINRSRLEALIHKFFDSTRLKIEIKDRFGNPVVPKEWFLVPLFIIDEAIERIRNGSIVNCRYDAKLGKIIETSKKS